MKYIIFLMFSFSALAQSQIKFEQVVTSGTGCPEGTVSTIISPDGATLSLIFDEFRVEVPNYETPAPPTRPGRPTQPHSQLEQNKVCNISFVTTLPAGKKADAIQIKLNARGNTMMDAGIQGYFTTILVGHRGLANSVGPQAKVVEKKFWMGRTVVDEDWTTDTVATVPLKSGCASHANKSIKFDLKNHLEAKILTNNLQKSGMITVDSNDATGMLQFSLVTSSCGGR